MIHIVNGIFWLRCCYFFLFSLVLLLPPLLHGIVVGVYFWGCFYLTLCAPCHCHLRTEHRHNIIYTSSCHEHALSVYLTNLAHTYICRIPFACLLVRPFVRCFAYSFSLIRLWRLFGCFSIARANSSYRHIQCVWHIHAITLIFI